MATDHYTTLGVQRTATQKEIKAAFRALAHTHHPDKGGDEKKFQEINRAYQTLSNTEKRSQYDRYGEAAQSFNGFGTGQGGFEHTQYYTHFTRGYTDQRFTMSSLKKIPFLTWIMLSPLIILVIFFGAIILGVSLIRSVSRSLK